MTYRILAVDDDLALLDMIELMLVSQGFQVVKATDGPSAVSAVAESHPDLVLLDVMLPGFSGVEAASRIRKDYDLPIIMLTAKSDTEDVVNGLQAGADDYVPKPFKPAELIARINACLRRLPSDGSPVLRLKDITIDTVGHRATKGDDELQITPIEFKLVATVAANPEKVFTREELLEQVWDYQYKADTRLVNVHVQRLRAKIEIDPENPEYIVTVRGVGYAAGS